MSNPSSDLMGAAKEALRAAVKGAISRAAQLEKPIEAVRGIALYDSSKDAIVKAGPPFLAAKEAISALPLVQNRFGAAEAERIVLQFAYGVFDRLSATSFDESLFLKTWDAFVSELDRPEWTYRAVANLRYFQSAEPDIALGDGVRIVGRDFEMLRELGFSAHVTDAISEDWHESGASSFVMLVEHTVPKTPKNVVLLDATMWITAQRAIGALRLLAPGEVSIGKMWIHRHSAFNFGLGGAYSAGGSMSEMGGDFFTFTPPVASAFQDVYEALKRLEQTGYGRSPGNLDLALRSFMGTYDRWPPSPDSRLLDAITALEAILGSGSEISFKLAFRVAALLAADDQKRSELLQAMKGFYDTRSALVHGSGMKEKKHQDRLARIDEVRDWVRILLRSFVRFAASSAATTFDRTFFKERLDSALVSASEREALRKELGLVAIHPVT
jgi:hypothetical protein